MKKITPDALPNDIDKLKAMLLAAQSQVSDWENKYQRLLEQFQLGRAKVFGNTSEAYHPEQGELFNELEAEFIEPIEEEALAEPVTKIVTPQKRGKRQALPADIPRQRIELDLDESEKVCDCCQGKLHCIGEDKSERLEFQPAKLTVLEYVRPKYACRHCDEDGENNTIKQAPVAPSPIPKSFATPSLLTQIITNKYQYALPLYRQESMFKQFGIGLTRKTMSRWLMQSAHLLQPIFDALKANLLQQSIIFADETPVKVLKEEKQSSYMWVYCSGADSPQDNPDAPHNIVLYDYQNGRGGVHPKTFLSGFEGYLQTDGYSGYNFVENVTHLGCMAHARRKFMDAKKLQTKNKSGKADVALSMIQKLYAIERRMAQKTVQERYEARQKEAKPIFEKLHQWLTKQKVMNKSVLYKAINYMLNQWDMLIVYLEDGRLSIDNNRAERAVKPFVIGRKNWLFSNTENGAQTSAMLYSIIESAKANGLMVFDYLQTCLEALSHPAPDIEALLPWNYKPTVI